MSSKILPAVTWGFFYCCAFVLLMLCSGVGCETHSADISKQPAAPPALVRAPASPDSGGAAPMPLVSSPRPEEEAYDTIPPVSIRVHGQPLLLSRADVVRRLGEPDSTFGLTDDIMSCLRAADSAAVFEAYGHTVYLRQGTQLRFMQSRPEGTALTVDVGDKHIQQGVPLATLGRFFPVSYQHRFTQPDPRYQSLVICPPV